MSVKMLGDVSVAVMISFPSASIRLPDGTLWTAESTPLKLITTQPKVSSVFGWDVLESPESTGMFDRALTDEELVADVALVTAMPGHVEPLRAAGFRGAVYSPGYVQKGEANWATMVRLSASEIAKEE
jgi:hypothetical protein